MSARTLVWLTQERAFFDGRPWLKLRVVMPTLLADGIAAPTTMGDTVTSTAWGQAPHDTTWAVRCSMCGTAVAPGAHACPLGHAVAAPVSAGHPAANPAWLHPQASASLPAGPIEAMARSQRGGGSKVPWVIAAVLALLLGVVGVAAASASQRAQQARDDVRRVSAAEEELQGRVTALEQDVAAAGEDIVAVEAERDAAVVDRDAAMAERDAAVVERDGAQAAAQAGVEAQLAEGTAALDARSAELDARSLALDEREAAISQAETAAAMAMIPGEGQYMVGIDVLAGRYTSQSSQSCYYAVYTGDGQTLLDNSFVESGQSIAILSDGQIFETEGCGTWSPA